MGRKAAANKGKQSKSPTKRAEATSSGSAYVNVAVDRDTKRTTKAAEKKALKEEQQRQQLLEQQAEREQEAEA